MGQPRTHTVMQRHHRKRSSSNCVPVKFEGPDKAADDAVVYLITHTGFGARQDRDHRLIRQPLEEARTRGRQVLCTVVVPDESAPVIEAGILDWWRGEPALPAYLGQREMRRGRLDGDGQRRGD